MKKSVKAALSRLLNWACGLSAICLVAFALFRNRTNVASNGIEGTVQHLRHSRALQEEDLYCRVAIVQATTGQVSRDNFFYYCAVTDEDGKLDSLQYYSLDLLPQDWYRFPIRKRHQEYNTDYIRIPGGTIVPETASVSIPDGAIPRWTTINHFPRSEPKSSKKVLILKVETAGTSRPQEPILEAFEYATRQYESCSFRKLNFYSPELDVITIPIASEDTAVVVQNRAIANAISHRGLEGAHGLLNFDHIMVCLPRVGINFQLSVRSTSQWSAYGYLNDIISVFNEDFCQSATSIMHQFGHNYDLRNSRLIDSSGDDVGLEKTGIMGTTYRENNVKRMCFNGQKNWLIKWYDPWYKDLDAEIKASTSQSILSVHVKLAPLVDFEKVRNFYLTTGDYVVGIKIGGHFVTYNKATWFNEDTQAAKNMVTVVREVVGSDPFGYDKDIDFPHLDSEFVGALSAGQHLEFDVGDYHTDVNCSGHTKLAVSVCSFEDGGEIDSYADVYVGCADWDPCIVVEQVVLIDADTNKDVRVLDCNPGAWIDLAEVGPNLSMRAEVTGPVESVRFQMDTNKNFQIENVEPYALAGDDTMGDYFPWSPEVGRYILYVVPYSQKNAQGIPGFSKFCWVEIVNGVVSAPPPPPCGITGFVLINTLTNKPIRELRTPHDTINVAINEDGPDLNVRADFLGPVESVVFELTGSADQTENKVPFALKGDVDGNYFSWTPSVGKYNIRAIPYKEKEGQGESCDDLHIDVDVIDDSGSAHCGVTRFVLVDGNTNRPIRELHMPNDTIEGGSKLTVRADAIGPVKSVVFELTGSTDQAENEVHFALKGDVDRNYFSWTPSVGTYNMRATSYKETGGQGESCDYLEMTFFVV